MKVGYSSLGCPDWDLEAIVSNAKEMGYDGVELCGLQGQMHLPAVAALASDPDAVRAMFAEAGVELVCLASDASFHSRKRHEVADEKAKVREYIELAGRLGVPFVCVQSGVSGRIPLLGFETRNATLGRIAEAMRDLAPVAAEHRVTLVIENQGDFSDSAATWFVLDFVSHPAVKACYNPFNGTTVLDRPGVAVPRLGVRIGLTRVCDGKFENNGRPIDRAPLGEGDVELDRMVQLLRGVAYEGYLMFAWPKRLEPGLAPPEEVFRSAQETLRKLIDAKQDVLTAYKGDKNAPVLGPAPAGPPAPATA